MPVGSEDATQPAISLNGNNLAFVQGSAVFGILRVSASTNASRETKRVADCLLDRAGLGPQHLSGWRAVCVPVLALRKPANLGCLPSTGTSLRQLTQLDGVISGPGSPSWSPDGGQILFDARIYGHAHIFVIAACRRQPRNNSRLETSTISFRAGRQTAARFTSAPIAADAGNFGSCRCSGGTPQAVTSDDGIVGQESPDGKWLYFARGDESNGIWRMPASGGEAVRILDQPMAGYWGYWAVTPSGIYFLDQRQSTPSISLYDPVTQKITVFAKLNRLPPTFRV
jgi:Tol biopolymer transport system component